MEALIDAMKRMLGDQQVKNTLALIADQGFVIVPKEPTAAMEAAGADENLSPEIAGYVWRDMVDEALKGAR